ncbi:MAG: hypothetical protein ACREXP_25950 [Steroidobacteraceae bacterium]
MRIVESVQRGPQLAGVSRRELYRLDRELFVATMDVAYNEPRRELIRGEGLVYL